jgi:carbamoyltransferase
MFILGISGLRGQSTAAIVRDGQVIAACEEAKLCGRRNPHGLPRQAIRFCLEAAGIAAHGVGALALDFHPWRLLGSELGFRMAKLPRALFASAAAGIASFNRTRELLHDLRQLEEMFPQAKVLHFDHQLTHAAAAYFASGFERALTLTLDGGGGSDCALVAMGEGGSLRPLASAHFPNTPGFLFSQMTAVLGFHEGEDEHRTQWLSTIGVPRQREIFRRYLEPLHHGELRLEPGCFNPGVADRVCLDPGFLRDLGVPDGDWRKASALPQEKRADLAASLQAALEDALLTLLAHWKTKTGADSLCFGGGVAFNALLVQALAESSGFARGFVSPAAGNAGCALGAAWLAAPDHALQTTPFSPYLGPSFPSQQIKDLLDNCRLHYRNLTQPQLIQEVVERMAQGAFVGWFQGPAEFGPRALGNRSILALPQDEWVKENLNAFTKRRESYRPLAASVTEEAAGAYFEFPWASPCSYLGTVARVKDPAAIPGLAFGGNRARVHVVSRSANRLFHDLLVRAGQQSGRPLLINTSFNAPGEPLVVTPQEALRVFYSTGIDCLAIGEFLIVK